jgi:hypothetical protein
MTGTSWYVGMKTHPGFHRFTRRSGRLRGIAPISKVERLGSLGLLEKGYTEAWPITDSRHHLAASVSRWRRCVTVRPPRPRPMPLSTRRGRRPSCASSADCGALIRWEPGHRTPITRQPKGAARCQGSAGSMSSTPITPFHSDSWSSPDELLDVYSADGWELVSHSQHGSTLTFVFKRPAPSRHTSN